MDAQKQMARMVDSIQPHCDEPITAAMTCSHAGSMSSLLFSKMTGGLTGMNRLVFREGHPPYPGSMRQIVPLAQVGRLVPGTQLPVKVDPSDTTAIWIDWGSA